MDFIFGKGINAWDQIQTVVRGMALQRHPTLKSWILYKYMLCDLIKETLLM